MIEKASILESPLKWNELKQEAMQFWRKLTPDDLNQLKGDFNSLKAQVKKIYRYNDEEIEDDFKAFLRKWKKKNY